MAAVETASPMMGTAAACDALGSHARPCIDGGSQRDQGLRGRRRHVR